MNRKAFLSSIAALISIPFIGKSKEEEPVTNEEIARHYKVPPAYLHNQERAIFRIKGEDLMLPRHRPIEPEDVENFVRAEIKRCK